MDFREIKIDDRMVILHFLAQLTTTPIINEDRFKLFLDTKSNSIKIYMMLVDKIPVGMGTLLLEKKIIHNLGIVGHIEDIVIDKKYRGSGYGIELIKFLVHKAKNSHCYKIILDCDEKNKKFYEKCLLVQKGVCMAMYVNP
tara:strand:- start:676 stop:1098 length:423 start_codon:yes stop_codon:yes gene_type:complete